MRTLERLGTALLSLSLFTSAAYAAKPAPVKRVSSIVRRAEPNVIATRTPWGGNFVATLERGRDGHADVVRNYTVDPQRGTITKKSGNLVPKALAAVQKTLPAGGKAYFKPYKSGDGYGALTRGGTLRVSVKGTADNQDRLVGFGGGAPYIEVSKDPSQKIARATRVTRAIGGAGAGSTVLASDNEQMKVAVVRGKSSVRVVTVERKSGAIVGESRNILPKIRAAVAGFEKDSGKRVTKSSFRPSDTGKTLQFYDTYAKPDAAMVKANDTGRTRQVSLASYGDGPYKNRGTKAIAAVRVIDGNDGIPSDRK
jgi:hypothetical protein